MKWQGWEKEAPYIIPAGIVFLVLAGVMAYGFVRITTLTNESARISAELASTTNALIQNTNDLSANITDLRARTIGLSDTLVSTQQHIDAVKTQVGGVEQTVGSISGTVGTLQKLAQIDPELLIKYSKVFFLSDNYKPAHLTDIPSQYLYNEGDNLQFLTEARPFLVSMLDAAKSAGTEIYVKSAFRSFSTQQTLKSAYTVVYGAGTANSFSADQGYSEHQLGTTVDLITTGLGGQLEGFDNTSAYMWLLNNAYRFGFVLSYPKDNSYYVFEPWHWRFVGVGLATDLHNRNLHFYDLDQREIDTYLANIFD